MSAATEAISTISAEIDAAHVAIDAAAAVAPGALDRSDLGPVLARVCSLESKVKALKLRTLAEAERRALEEDEADTDTGAWAARLTGTTRGVMTGGLWLSRLLESKYDATRRAFARGQIDEDQVRVIVRAAEKLPDLVTDEQRAVAEEGLVEKAVAGMNAKRLRYAARRMLDKISKELADRHETDQLEDEEDRARLETWLTLKDNGDGTVSGKFIIPELHAEFLRQALEKLTAPRRHTRNKAGEPVEDDTIPTGAPTYSYADRLGMGFCELLEHLPTEGFGPVGATVLVHLQYESLLSRLGSARLDTGVTISPGEARRLACGAGIVPLVLNGQSEVLDAGRQLRLHNEAMRRALSVRHDSCAAEGCERPFAWCEIHHPHAWSEGGGTNVKNGIPLCGHHHRRAHDERYYVRYLASGEVRFRRRYLTRPRKGSLREPAAA